MSFYNAFELYDVFQNAFELYGADFILTEDFRPWLLEINSSPGMAPSSVEKCRLCAAVMDDTIKGKESWFTATIRGACGGVPGKLFDVKITCHCDLITTQTTEIKRICRFIVRCQFLVNTYRNLTELSDITRLPYSSFSFSTKCQ